MRRTDLKAGAVIRVGGSVFQVAQVNLFRTGDRILGGVVFPMHASLTKGGYDVRAVLHNGRLTTMAPTLRRKEIPC